MTQYSSSADLGSPPSTGNVQTDGGTYVAGSATAGNDFVGRDKNTFANSLVLQLALETIPTPDQLTALLQTVPAIRQGLASFGNLVDSLPEFRNASQGLRQLCMHTRQQMGRALEYKSAHDLLQRLESAYRLLAPEIYDFGRLLDADRLNWKRIRDLCGAVQQATAEVCRHGNSSSFAIHARGWLDQLHFASNMLRQGYEDRKLQLLDAGAQDIYEVISGRITEMNNRLVEAVDSLDFPGLIESLHVARNHLAADVERHDPRLKLDLESFTTGMTTLESYANAMMRLCRAHYSWQESYDLLISAQDQLGQNFERLVGRWERIIKTRLLALCQIETQLAVKTHLAECCTRLAETLNAYVNAGGASGKEDIEDALYELRAAVTSRFCEIDYDLLRVCEQLRDADGPLEAILEKLR